MAKVTGVDGQAVGAVVVQVAEVAEPVEGGIDIGLQALESHAGAAVGPGGEGQSGGLGQGQGAVGHG